MMDSKVNRTHKNVVGFTLREGKYVIAFNEYIYDDWRDFIALEEIIRKLLKPDKDYGFGGFDDMHGTFIKDSIRVETWWGSFFDYFWEIDTDDEAVQKKVYDWAAAVYDEYLKSENKV